MSAYLYKCHKCGEQCSSPKHPYLHRCSCGDTGQKPNAPTLLRQRIAAHRRAVQSLNVEEIDRTWEDLEQVIEYLQPAKVAEQTEAA